MKTYLVTGGAGFIGSHIAEELVRRGEKVRVLDNFSTGKRDNLAPFRNFIELIEGDIRELETCRRALRGVGLTRKTLTSLGLGGGASAAGVLTAGAATVACCGAGAASILLTLLGAGAGVGLFLAEHDRAFGGLGLLLMLANLWVAARWVRAGGLGR